MTEVASELNKSTALQVSCSVLSRKPKLIAYDTYCHTSDFCVHECMHVHVNLVYTKPPCSCVSLCVSYKETGTFTIAENIVNIQLLQQKTGFQDRCKK